MKTSTFSILALEAVAAFALPKANPNDLVPRAPLNFGRCSDPSIAFGVGFDGRTEASFQPNDKVQFNHGSAQNIGVIAGFICDRFRDSCGASTDAQTACTAAIEAIAAEIGQAAADAWNNALGIGKGSGKGASATGASSSATASSSSSGPFTNGTETAGVGGSGAGATPVGPGAGGAAGGSSASPTAVGSGNGGSAGKGQGGGKGRGGGKGGNKGGKGTSASGSGALPSSTGASSATPPSASGTTGGAGGAAGSGSNSSALLLDPNNVQTGSQSDGQANATKGQSPSATDNANFINFCGGQTLTNGLQVKSGSCNGIVMGQIPATTNMISSVVTFPGAGTSSNLKANQDFDIQVQVQGLEAGSFTNPDNTYYAAPQQLKGGRVVGHTHVTVQTLGNSLTPTQPPDPTTFVFFKGINDAGNGNGGLKATVAGGLPSGNYRVCTMTSSSNHQPVLMPVAQRGAQDDCEKFAIQ